MRSVLTCVAHAGVYKPRYYVLSTDWLLCCRYGRVWQVHLHQADAHYPWRWILGRWQERLYQTCLPKHFHGNAVNGGGYEAARNIIRRRPKPGMSSSTLFLICTAYSLYTFRALVRLREFTLDIILGFIYAFISYTITYSINLVHINIRIYWTYGSTS